MDQRFSDLFACPGKDISEPENMVECYRAGHRCEPVKPYREVSEDMVTVRFACPCCGSISSAMGYPKSWVDENPRFEDQIGDIARRLNDG